MKTKLISLLAIVLIFVGCSKEDNPTPEVPVNKAPVVTAINFEKDAYGDDRVIFNRDVFGLNQIVIARAEVSDPENDNISLSWSSGSNDFGKGQDLELKFGRINPNAEVTAKATDTENNTTTFTRKFSVIDCDFGYGLWGDNIDIIKQSETGIYAGSNAGVIYEFLEEGRRFYTFTNDALVSGLKRNEYTPKVLQPTQFGIAWILYEETLSKLISKYGEYSKQETSITFTGNKEKDGLSLINGATIDTYFSNPRSNIHFRVYHSRNTATTVIYDVKYSKKN